MVLDHRISRRQLLKSGAAGAAAATLATLGPTVALGAGKAKLIPEDKVGTITFTQRDVPGRLGIAASAAAGVAPTMGNLGGDDIFTMTRTMSGRSCRCRAAGRSSSSSSRSSASRRSSSPATARTPTTPAARQPPIAPGNVYNPAVKPAYLDYGRTLRGFLDDFGLGGDRQPRVHPGHVARPGIADGDDVCRR